MPDSSHPSDRVRHAAERELHVGHLTANLGRRALKGGAVMFAAQAVKLLVQFGAVILLARLLPPTAFGLVAMVVAISVTLDLARDLGLSAVTIQKSDLSHEQVSALFWINAALGAGLGLALFLLAPFIADFYDQPSLTEVTRWLSLAFLLSGLSTQHCALLRRQMRFTEIAVLESGADILGLAVAVGLALAGADYWALVAQRLTPPVVTIVASWYLCRWRPAWPRRTAGVGELLSSGVSIAGTNVMAALARGVDQILIGWMWGPVALGIYERASKLLMVPLNNISLPLYTVALPSLSRLTEQVAAYRLAIIGMLEKVALVTVPTGVLVAVTADWVVALLFGARWADASLPVACFGVIAMYQPPLVVVGLLFISSGRSREYLHCGLIDAALTILSILAGLPFGVTGVAVSLAVVGLVVRTPVIIWLGTRAGPVHQRDVYRALLMPFATGIAVAVAVVALRHFVLGPANLSTASTGLVCAGIAALIVMSLPAWLVLKKRPQAASHR